MRHSILILTFLSVTCNLYAIAPKKIAKLNKSVVSVVTYDKNGNLLHTGNGFFIDNNGCALSEYSLFDNAARAEIIDSKGEKWPVTRIMGVNDLYNLIKVKVKCDETMGLPKVQMLPSNISENTDFFIIPFSKQKKNDPIATTITKTEKINNGQYYTLTAPYSTSNCGLPLVNENGELTGIIQRNGKDVKENTYAISPEIISTLSIKALSLNNETLKKIHIQLAIPENENDAAVFLYLLSQNPKDSIAYFTALNDFIQTYPKQINGYLDRARYYADRSKYELCQQDIENALNIGTDKDQIHYAFGKIIYQKILHTPNLQFGDWTLEKALTEAQTAYNENPLPIYLLFQGDCLFGLKKYEQAYEKYQEVNQSSIASAETFYYAAKAKEKAGATSEELIALLDSAIAKYPKPYPQAAAPYFFERANQHIKSKQYKKAVLDFNEYEHLVGYQNLNDRFYYLREQAEIAGKMYEQAINDIERAKLLNPQETVYHIEHAFIMLRTNQNDAAIQSAQTALEQQPKNSDAYKILGLAWGEKGDKDKAIYYLNKAKELGASQIEELLKLYK